MNSRIAARRLRNQAITGPARRTPADAVRWLGAVQAQEFGPARWALALRMVAGARDGDVGRAFDAGRILRTHVMRPTWHFVTPADIRWMLELTAPRVHLRMGPPNRQLELDPKTLARAAAILERVLAGSRFLTRAELAVHLARAGIPAAGQRLAHLLMHAELERVVCSGPRRGRQFTYALLDERAPRARRLTRDEALGTLARRFLRSHGPATVRDFVWWSGLLAADARRAFEIVRAIPERAGGLSYWALRDSPRDFRRSGRAHLLPVYDEYLVAYRDRDAVPHWPPGVPPVAGRLAALQNPVVIDGQVRALWRTAVARRGAVVQVVSASRLGRAERAAVHAAALRYAAVLETPLPVEFR